MKKTTTKRILSVIFLSCIEMSIIAKFIYTSNHYNIVPNFENLAVQLLATILYNIIIISPRIIIFIILYLYLKQDFKTEMMLQIKNESKKFVFIVGGIYSFIIIFSLFTNSDKISVLWNAFYYLFIIALPEELFFRGVCPYLLKNCNKYSIYFVPNIMFAFSHIFAISGFGTITLNTIYVFFTFYFLQYILFGVLVQWLKMKTRTLWTSILFHAILDFFILFSMNFPFGST